MHGLLADLARFAAIDVGNAAEERALQISEGIAAHSLDAELRLHRLGERIREQPGPRKLYVAVRVALDLLGERNRDRRSVRVMNPLRNRDDAAPMPLDGGLHVGEEFFHREGAL